MCLETACLPYCAEFFEASNLIAENCNIWFDGCDDCSLLKDKKTYLSENGHKFEMSRNNPDLTGIRCTSNRCNVYREPFCKSEWDYSDECPLRYIDRKFNKIVDPIEEVPVQVEEDNTPPNEPEPTEEETDEDVDEPIEEVPNETVDPNQDNIEITAGNGSAVITIVLIAAVGGGFLFFLII